LVFLPSPDGSRILGSPGSQANQSGVDASFCRRISKAGRERIFLFASAGQGTILAAMKLNFRTFGAGFSTMLVLFTAAFMNGAQAAEDLTAFQLIKEGNRHVGEDSKDRVVQIRSEKSIGSLTPNIWYVVYYDPDASTKATEVKFGAGVKLDVKRQFRLFELAGKGHLPLDKEKLKTDSDKAIKIATSEPLLKNVKVLATRLTLDRWEEMPVWKVRLWAAKIRNPNKDVDIGEVFVAAENGKVVKNDLHINRVD
jgi:hypothetical protein